MDHLVRTPLLIEAAAPSKQRLKPGARPKDRTRQRRAKTAASQPHAGGEANLGRRVHDRQMFNNPRDVHKGFYSRRAQQQYLQRRTNPHQHHLTKTRANPQAEQRPEKRGNPQAKTKTQVRISPSKQQRRPTLPQTPKFFDRGVMTGGRGK